MLAFYGIGAGIAGMLLAFPVIAVAVALPFVFIARGTNGRAVALAFTLLGAIPGLIITLMSLPARGMTATMIVLAVLFAAAAVAATWVFIRKARKPQAVASETPPS